MSERIEKSTSAESESSPNGKRRAGYIASVVLLVFFVFSLFVILDLNDKVQNLTSQVERLERQVSGNFVPEEPSRTDWFGLEESEPDWSDVADRDVAVDPSLHKVYLTFDDGPSVNTNQILDILAEYDVKATFFVVGKEDAASRAAIQRIVEEGHTLGMHSYSHKYSELYESPESFAADLEKMQNFLYEVTGEMCYVYRFPGGSSNTVGKTDMKLLAEYLDSKEVVYYDWNVVSGDAEGRKLSVEALVRNSTETISQWKTAIVLMHDAADKPGTVEALPEIIEKIQAMDDTVILPITKDTVPIQHLHRDE